MAKDYYVVLGVGHDATRDQIKSAYRSKAKRWHPDRTREGSEPFQIIQEAYDVLGDAGRRQAYDEELARDRRRVQNAARESRSEPLRRRPCPVEPLVPARRTSRPRDVFSQSPIASLIEEFFDHPFGAPDTPIQPRAWRRRDGIHVRVSLTREQALRGGRIRLWVPVQNVCPACRGRGVAGFFECLYCDGNGAVVSEHPVDIEFPGGLVDGAEGRVSLSLPGMGDLSLMLYFRVREW